MKYEFSITGFGFASHSLNSTQKTTINNIAQRLIRGDKTIPQIVAIEDIEIIGHAKGSRNLEKHANTRADAVLNKLKTSLSERGASNAEITKIRRGKPITKLSSSPAKVGDRQVRIIVNTKKQGAIQTVGAWCGAASLANPERDVEFALTHSINRLDIVINDHARWRTEKDFTARNSKSIKALCKLAQDNGIETHLMSWIMPFERYIKGAARILVPLCEETGASSLQWDAEEPWMLAKKKNRLGYKQAAGMIADEFSGLSCEMGVNAIGFASMPKLSPLLEVCDYGVPQAYSTSRNNLKPGTGQKKIYNRWRKHTSKPIVMGLAAWSQGRIPGHTVKSAMETCFDACGELGCSTVIYWQLRHIRNLSKVSEVIKEIRE